MESFFAHRSTHLIIVGAGLFFVPLFVGSTSDIYVNVAWILLAFCIVLVSTYYFAHVITLWLSKCDSFMETLGAKTDTASSSLSCASTNVTAVKVDPVGADVDSASLAIDAQRVEVDPTSLMLKEGAVMKADPHCKDNPAALDCVRSSVQRHLDERYSQQVQLCFRNVFISLTEALTQYILERASGGGQELVRDSLDLESPGCWLADQPENLLDVPIAPSARHVVAVANMLHDMGNTSSVTAPSSATSGESSPSLSLTCPAVEGSAVKCFASVNDFMKFEGCWENYKNDDINLGVSTSRMRTLLQTVSYKTLKSVCSPDKSSRRQRLIVEGKFSSGGSSDPVIFLACKLDFRGRGEFPTTALDLIPDRKWRVLHLGQLHMLGFSEWVPMPLLDDTSNSEISKKSCASDAGTKDSAPAYPSLDRQSGSKGTAHSGSGLSNERQRAQAIEGSWIHSRGGLVKVELHGDALKVTNPYIRIPRYYSIEGFFESDVQVSYEGHTGILDDGLIVWSNGSWWKRETEQTGQKQLVSVFLWPVEPVADYFGKLARGEIPSFEVRVAAHGIEGEDMVIEEATLPMVESSPAPKTMSKRYFRRFSRKGALGPLAASIKRVF